VEGPGTTGGKIISPWWNLSWRRKGRKPLCAWCKAVFWATKTGKNEWFESTDYGWGFMLLSLRWSLERHPGVPRQVAWPRVKTALSSQDAYAKVVSSGGVLIEDASGLLNQGSSFVLRTTTGATDDRGNAGKNRGANLALRVRVARG